MKLSTDYQDIPFIIEILIDKNYKEPPTQQADDEERELLLSQEISYYNLIIQNENGQSSHYLPGLLFSSNQEELLEELNEYLFDGDVLDQIIEIQKTAQNGSLIPKWSK